MPLADTAADRADPAEVARFDALARTWWDAAGPLGALHAINPARLAFIRDSVTGTLGRDPLAARPLAGLTALDIGCGGGLLAEPLARLGAQVTGIDPSLEAIAVARAHAAEQGLAIDYRAATADDLAAAGARFDLVLAMEVVEHVPDADAFLATAAALVAPNGMLAAATLNRTPKAWLMGVVLAEYVLGWVERGTHDWRRFRRPAEMARALRGAGLRTRRLQGLAYDPLRDRWSLGDDLGVNYLLFSVRDPLTKIVK